MDGTTNRQDRGDVIASGSTDWSLGETDVMPGCRETGRPQPYDSGTNGDNITATQTAHSVDGHPDASDKADCGANQDEMPELLVAPTDITIYHRARASLQIGKCEAVASAFVCVYLLIGMCCGALRISLTPILAVGVTIWFVMPIGVILSIKDIAQGLLSRDKLIENDGWLGLTLNLCPLLIALLLALIIGVLEYISKLSHH